MQIGNKIVDVDQPTYIVGEIGVNHNGDLALAKKLIDIASEAKVDAVKFQTLNAAKYISTYAPKAKYQLATTDHQESQVNMVRRYELSKDQHVELMAYCKHVGISFFSTPFDFSGADLLDELDVAVYKIPSGEITNLPLIQHIAEKGRPIILSTGMSFLGEVEQAVDLIQKTGCNDLVLLHCVSNYPAQPVDANLKAMHTMSQAFGVPVGYSDHTPGIEVSIAAVTLGACMIEKHFTLDKDLEGPDHQASLEPGELKSLVQAIRNVELCLGDGIKIPKPSETNTREVARKSLVATRLLSSGTVLTKDCIDIKRPGTGISPIELKYVLGKKINQDINEDELLSWEMIG